MELVHYPSSPERLLDVPLGDEDIISELLQRLAPRHEYWSRTQKDHNIEHINDELVEQRINILKDRFSSSIFYCLIADKQ